MSCERRRSCRSSRGADTHERVTHGRHCSCTPCQREDWTQPHLQHCGMHGDDCPDLVADTQQEQPHEH